MNDSFDWFDCSHIEHDEWLWGEAQNLFAAFDPDDPEGSRKRISAIDENTLTCVWEMFAVMREEKHLAEPDRQALETFSRIEALFK